MSGIRQIVPVPVGGRRFRAYTDKHLDALTARAGLGEAERLAVRAVGTVLPFRTNAYVVEELIDWSAAPDDPLYRLVFPQADMLPLTDVARIAGLLARGAPEPEITAAAHEVRMRLNPHPAGQLALPIGPEPVTATLAQIAPLHLVPVTSRAGSARYNQLIRDHHYLGYTPLAGAQIRYLVQASDAQGKPAGVRLLDLTASVPGENRPVSLAADLCELLADPGVTARDADDPMTSSRAACERPLRLPAAALGRLARRLAVPVSELPEILGRPGSSPPGLIDAFPRIRVI